MGGRKAGFDTNRTEFTPENALNGDIEYTRSGGCFVTTKKAICLVILAIIALVTVGALIYLFGMSNDTNQSDNSGDIEKLLNDSLNNIKIGDLRLPSHVQPLHYRLRMYPHLDEPSLSNFTFTGRVTILIKCVSTTNTIVLNSEDLVILKDEVSVISTDSQKLKSLSQILPSKTGADEETSNITDTTVAQTNETFPQGTTPGNGSDKKLSSPSPHASVSAVTELPMATNNGKDPPGSTPNDSLNKKENLTIATFSSSSDFVYQTAKLLRVPVKSFEENKEMSRYIIHLMKPLETGRNYTLDIKFSGKILNDLTGLYKTSYFGSTGRKRWLLTTHFQPIFARRVFPCFDEPSFKATYEISIARQTNMTALSNMPLKESEKMLNQTGWVWDHFEKSPPMSSYLVSFTICDFEHLKPATSDLGPVFKVWAPKQSLSHAQYALEVGPKILTYLQNYFGVKYPLSKIDLVAVPELPRTATENWGLISFRDTALLLDPNFDSWEARNHIFKTIVRKLTTQWFGNLVTMDWWSELWLSEGFSTYMEDVVENAIEPTLEDLDTFSLRVTQAILDVDKLKSVRSLDVAIKDTVQIEQLFDDVTFNKGSCIIRMLNYTLTQDVFKEGVQRYLKTWMFKSSNQDYFWQSLTEAATNKTAVIPSDLSIKSMMDSWIKQQGYPVVTVIRDYTTGNAVINQSRFIGNSTNNYLWHIPLTYTKEKDHGETTTLWLQKESMAALNFTEPGNETWVIFNVEQAGFYRVNYDQTNWKLIQNQLMGDPSKILPSNRGQLLNDAFELANSGLLDYKVPLELTKYLKSNERNYIPWNSVYNSLQTLEYIMGRTQYNGILQRYIIGMTRSLYDELGTAEKAKESQNDKLLRNFIVKVACSNNYRPCLEWAKQKYQEWITHPDPDKNNPIPFDLHETVQCAAIKMGGEAEWEFLWNRTRYSMISPINLREAYLSLGCSREPWLITRYLENSLNGGTAIQNIQYVWKSIAHPVGLNAGFTFLRMNWDRICTDYEHIIGNLKSIFEDFLSKLSTETDLEDLTSFYKKNKKTLHPVSSMILSVVDRIKWRINWSQSHMDAVTTWLSQNI